ncbi:MAG: patatin-like protein [Chlorobiaceae bacterium]|nr:patatin-like protein [Chlorobiaceae bacterium]
MNNTQEKITSEIRFAVVMYGGVSLAVYMNGIAQELLSMVRSTSLSLENPDDLTGTASVYRDMAKHLSAKDKGAFDYRFVVDIISGTSAGGINGICLAKGLVRGLDNLKALEKTWLDEGDIDKLLNDRQSQPDRYNSKEPKSSLFNSQRMYAKLFDAFKEMQSAAANKAPHIYAMDLFVTATDLRGLQLPVLLSDGKAFERLHKHVFPFAFRSPDLYPNRTQDHFTGDYDPMLAFASRCTSSFPTAFEPVTLDDIMLFLKQHDPKSHDQFKNNLTEWERLFFSAYSQSDTGIPLLKREFADGGYLDNRPFGHAIQAIHAREAYCPVSRKLLFIDPVPETQDDIGQMQEISFVKNSVLASFALPGYETIREEIDALRRRNNWIDTVNNILDKLDEQNIATLKTIIEKHFLEFQDKPEPRPGNVDRTIAKPRLFALPSPDPAKADNSANSPAHDEEVRLFWKNVSSKKSAEKLTACSTIPAEEKRSDEELPKYDSKDLGEMVETLGSGYTAYHYTRLSNQTDQLAQMIIRAMNAERRPDIAKVVTQIVTAWRKDHFASTHKDCDKYGKKTENMFFRNFDIDFRIRRLNFFRKTIETAIQAKSTKELYFDLIDEGKIPDFKLDEDFATAIMVVYNAIVDSIKQLYRLKALLLSDSSQNPLAVTAALLRARIESLPEEERQACSLPPISDSFDKLADCFDSFSDRSTGKATFGSNVEYLMMRMNVIIKKGWRGRSKMTGQRENGCDGTVGVCNRIYDAFETLGKKYPEITGRIWYVYDYGYDLYDSTKLTLLAGGQYGEGRRVEVYRISPADTVSLWDESARNRSKLAGIALSAFGGFLDREWRRNDILWGRLDAAERIISAILPESADAAMKTESILKAQKAIIDETTRDWMKDLEGSRFSCVKDSEQYNRLQSIRKLLDSHADVLPDGSVPHPPEWKTQFSSAYDFHREFEPEPNLRRLGRSSAILSSMIDRLDGGKGIGGKISAYLKTLNRVLLGMLDFSTPKTMLGVLSHYWLQLIVLVSVTMISAGYLLGSISSMKAAGITVNRCGWVLLALDLAVWIIRMQLKTRIHKIGLSPWIRKLFRTPAAASIAAVLILALLFLASETMFVHREEILTILKTLWQIFWKGFLEIITQQIGLGK